jgi:hypothetical protein
MARNRVGRPCSICMDDRLAAINMEIVQRTHGFRVISSRYGVSYAALQRHAATHLRETIRTSKELRAMLDAQALTARLLELDEAVTRILRRAEHSGDDRLALLAIREGRADVESFARIGVVAEVERRLHLLEQGGTSEVDSEDEEEAAYDAAAL